MLIVDDVFTLPFRGLLWVFEEIYNAAEQELRQDASAISAELQQLYTLLESGKVSEAEFERREAALLDRLDKIHERGSFIEDDEH